MSCEDGECVVYEQYDKSKHIKLLTEYIREFVQFKLVNMVKPELSVEQLEKVHNSRMFSEEIEKLQRKQRQILLFSSVRKILTLSLFLS